MLAKHIRLHIENEYRGYIDDHMDHTMQSNSIRAYAKKAAFAHFIFEQLRDIEQLSGGHNPTFNRDYRSFRMNLITVLETQITDPGIATSDQHFKRFCDRILMKSKQNENPSDWMYPSEEPIRDFRFKFYIFSSCWVGVGRGLCVG